MKIILDDVVTAKTVMPLTYNPFCELCSLKPIAHIMEVTLVHPVMSKYDEMLGIFIADNKCEVWVCDTCQEKILNKALDVSRNNCLEALAEKLP